MLTNLKIIIVIIKNNKNFKAIIIGSSHIKSYILYLRSIYS